VKYFFLDTSAFVKAYVVESGEKRVRGLIAGAVANPPSCRVVVTDFTFLEAISALLQKLAEKKISRAVCNASLAEIERLLKGLVSPYLVIETSDVAGDVPSIIRRYGLKPGDAVHIAAALAARSSTQSGVEFVFVTSDGNQAEAARAEGFTVWNPAVTD
jgi:predicted nucleic acid-binding protein